MGWWGRGEVTPDLLNTSGDVRPSRVFPMHYLALADDLQLPLV